MPFVVIRKPSGAFAVVPVFSRDEAALMDVAIRRLYTLREQAEAKCKELEAQREERERKLAASQMKLLDEDAWST